jgi:hypothetical protein
MNYKKTSIVSKIGISSLVISILSFPISKILFDDDISQQSWSIGQFVIFITIATIAFLTLLVDWIRNG